ncbi:5-hydroxytryptamine receptor 3A-like isoform X1 [Alosa sapidissima]|uniref:5-hydroxytryptamine receptor 3A-like isoform X1 n=1 Tax=Alosa sapidissima TaxID=34773 RepID=UPI001C0A4D57|nr:5-hydroxytryptamine receptor 3A-like isoform X1 [Alosa sapidissima]
MEIWVGFILVTLFTFSLAPTAGSVSEHVESRDLASVVRNLTRFSSPWVRPVRFWERPVKVNVDMRVLAILNVNEKEEEIKLHVIISQGWKDEHVWWNASSYGGLEHISLPSTLIWTPDIAVREAISEERQHTDAFVRVNSSGWVSREEVVMVTLRCDLAMMLFPFDTQHCNLTLHSHLHTVQELELCLEQSSVLSRTLIPVSTHGEWDLTSHARGVTLGQSHAGRPHSQLTFQLGLSRHSLFYVLNLLVPSALVMLVDLAGFCIPVDSAERLPFKVTLLLGYTVYLLLATDLLPPFRDSTPMLGVYLVVCLVFLSLSLSESALLLALGQHDTHTSDQPSPLYRMALRMNLHLPPPEDARRQHESSSRRVKRGLQRSFSVGEACGRDCVVRALGEELEDVGEEVRRLNVRRSERNDALRLMEALDSVCFRLYAAALAVFSLSLGLLWSTNH